MVEAQITYPSHINIYGRMSLALHALIVVQTITIDAENFGVKNFVKLTLQQN